MARAVAPMSIGLLPDARTSPGPPRAAHGATNFATAQLAMRNLGLVGLCMCPLVILVPEGFEA